MRIRFSGKQVEHVLRVFILSKLKKKGGGGGKREEKELLCSFSLSVHVFSLCLSLAQVYKSVACFKFGSGVRLEVHVLEGQCLVK